MIGLAALVLVSGISASIIEPAFAAGGDAPRSAVRSDVDDFAFSTFSADYYLDRDASGHSTLKTVERLTADFPSSNQNKGITRKIPDNYLGTSLHTTFVSVSDTVGVVRPYSVTDDGTYTTVSTGTDDYVHGEVTYTLTYTQRDVAGQFTDTNDQEFYWDTNGTQWGEPFAHLEARVHVAPALVASLSGHNACYQGAQGSTQQCFIASLSSPGPSSPGPSSPDTSATVFSATADNLSAGQNLTVAIGFADGTFTGAPQGSSSSGSGDTAARPDTVWGEIVGGLFLLIGLGAIPFALIRRFTTGARDARGRGTIVPQYDVPTGLNVMEAGTIMKLDYRSIPAQIVSFAVRGNLRILAYPVTSGSGADYTLEFTTDAGLDAEEAALIRVFFPELNPGATFEVVAAAVETSDIRAVKDAVHLSTVQQGWRVKASARAGLITALAIVGLLIAEIVVVAITDAVSALADLSVPITIVAIIVAFASAYRGFVLTPAGADQRDYLRGVKLYLTVAEADRIRILQSPTGAERINTNDAREVVKLYEKLLPFAVLFDIEDQWAEVLAVQYTDSTITPDWYVANGAFNAALFVGSLSSLSGAVTTSTMPIPTSSGGGSSFGGSSGGGFSGGGGGGGGGGGR
jgi:uncharacterized membrane protein YgcG